MNPEITIVVRGGVVVDTYESDSKRPVTTHLLDWDECGDAEFTPPPPDVKKQDGGIREMEWQEPDLHWLANDDFADAPVEPFGAPSLATGEPNRWVTTRPLPPPQGAHIVDGPGHITIMGTTFCWRGTDAHADGTYESPMMEASDLPKLRALLVPSGGE